MLNKTFFKGASLLGVSQILSAASSFVRNIVIANFVSVEDFGIATTFALTISLLEMTSNMAFERMLVQDDDGASDEMLASAHMLQFSKGLLTGLVLFLIANPVAMLFELPELIWAFQLLAVIPVVRGFVHWDMVVMQRNMDFRATAIVTTLPQILGLAIAYAAAKWLGDYRVMLLVVVAQATLTTVFSHIFAKRPYRWLFKRKLAAKKVKFGWPLLINGLLMFGIFQGDRALVGAMYDMHTLGWFSVAFTLTLLPTQIFASISGNLLMPLISKNKNDPIPFEQQCIFALLICIGCGTFMSLFFALGGKSFLALSFGEKYLQGNDLLMLLAIMQAIRMIRVAPTIISNSLAHTKNAMYSNMFRTLALPLAITSAYMGLPIETIVYCGIGGEVLALMASFALLPGAAYKPRLIRRALSLAPYLLVIAIVSIYLFATIDLGERVILNVALVTTGGLIGVLSAITIMITDSNIRTQVLKFARNR